MNGSVGVSGVMALNPDPPFGTAAEFTAIPLKQVVQLPEGVPLEQGACLGIPGITAHRAVHDISARCSSMGRELRCYASNAKDRSLGQWMSGLETRAARNVVIVATANKLARISWAVLSSGNDYQPDAPPLRVAS